MFTNHYISMILVATFGFLTGCNSNLRVHSTSVLTDEGNKSSLPNDGSISDTQNNSVKFEFAIRTEKGDLSGDKVMTSSPQPEAVWSSETTLKSVTLDVTLDGQCQDIIFHFPDLKSPSKSLEFLKDGQYHICANGTDIGGQSIPSSNNGMLLTLDRTAPVVTGKLDLFTNGTKKPELTTTDETKLTFQWTLISSASGGEILVSDPTILNPSFQATKEGKYSFVLTVVDEVGLSTTVPFSVFWDVTAPANISAGPNVIASGPTILTGTADGTAVAFEWHVLSGPSGGDVIFDQPTNLSTTARGTLDGDYVVQFVAIDEAGNKATTSITLSWDQTPPQFASLLGANEAQDGYINSSEITSTLPMWSLQASGATTVRYSGILVDTGSLSCDASQSYLNSGIPLINTLPGVDQSYTICVKLTDNANNITYGKSQVIVRDTVAPVFTSLALAHEAADGYLNATEIASTQALGTLSASGYGSASYSAILNDSIPITCDSSKTYSNATIPAVNQVPAVDSSYAFCVRLVDAAGNTTFGKSGTVIRDTNAPTVNVGGDILANSTSTIIPTTSGGSIFQWSKQSGIGTISFGSPTAQNTTVQASQDGVFTLRLTVIDVAGNTAYSELQFTWDTGAPIVTSFNTANQASDGFINNSESSSSLSVVNLVSSGASTILYSIAVASTTTCDSSATYGNATPPAISSIVADGVYLVCAKLVDTVANTSYGTSASFTRDTQAPVLTSFVGANGASDGFVNASEYLSPMPLLTLNASGMTTTSYSGILASSAVCDGSQTYNNSAIPLISDIAGGDGSYLVCVKLADAAGNLTYGASATIIKDITLPVISPLSDLTINTSTSTSATITGASIYSWSQTSGPGLVTFGSSSAMNTTMTANLDGTYGISIVASDAAGNSASRSFNLTWDTTAPIFTSLNGANEAFDGYINASESSSSLAMLSLSASGYTAVNYTTILNDSTPVTCDGAQTYGSTSIPLINTIPASDAPYAVCVKLSDSAGNMTYGKSQVITRDVTAPTFTSLALANGASDGYINSSEASSATAFATLNASGYTSANYTAILDDTFAVTCDSSKTYGNGSVPLINTIAADSTYALCVKLSDAAGNITYGKSGSIVKDTSLPVFTSLVGANGASDGYVNSTEYLSPAALLTLSASGYTTANYTSVLVDSALSCNGTQTYSLGSIPAISDIPGSDNNYAVCVKLADAAGNIVYGRSVQIIRDITPPSVNVGAAVATNSQVSLTPTVSGATTYSWTKQSGSGTITFGTPSTANTTAQASADGSFTLRLTAGDAAGNSAFADLSFTWDTQPPTVTSFNLSNGASDGYINGSESSSGLAPVTLVSSGATVITYSAIVASTTTCNGSVSYPNSSTPTISSMGTDGSFLVCAKLADDAGNTAYGTSQVFVRDTQAPTFTSLNGTNEATDGYINASEIGSSLSMLSLSASGYTTVNYTAILNDSTPVTCDGAQSYGNSSIPLINTMVASDAPYAVCVKLADNAGNITYGKSQVITRDVVAPTFTSMALANEAADGYINATESASTLDFATLIASGYTSALYTDVMAGGTALVCDAAKPYAAATMRPINAVAATGDVALCVKLTDAAGNITYGKSGVATRDIVAPTFTSLVGANGASDGYVNSSEYLSPAALLTLSASGQDTTNYTGILASTVTCDGTQTYSSSSIPLISGLPGADGSYAVCVKLADLAGNITYGKSQTIVRDITAPVFTSLVAANGASDGYVNSSEAASGLAFATLTASGQSTTNYTAILVDSPVTCDGAQTYSNSSVPAISTMGTDNTYALCVKLVDAAGNITYGKSSSVIKDTVTPTVNAGTDILTNVQVSSAATASGATTYSWVKTTGSGTITFGTPSALNTTISASADAAYTLTLTATDAAGNSASSVLNFTWDATAPIFTSLSGANEAADGYINNSETASALALLTLSASGYNTVNYTAILNDSTPVTCDAAKTYSNSSIPLINTMPASDAPYAVCVKLSDSAGNMTYGKSQVITRDVTAPTFTSLALANGASDGYINSSEASSATAFATLNASGYGTANYTAILDDTVAITCDGSKTYGNSSVPLINTIAADSTYALCVKLSDTAGNITYGKSGSAIKDTVAPTFTSLNGANGAFDGYVNASEYLSPAAMFSLNAANYNTASYTAVLVDSPITCDGSNTYSNSSIPLISDIPGADNTYAVCVKLSDSAGNITYGRSQSIVRDITAPTVNVGVDQSASSPLSLTPTVSGASSYAWTKQSGTGNVTFGSPTSANTTVSADASGSYTIRLTVSDAAGNSAFDEMILTYTVVSLLAGPSKFIALGNKGFTSLSWTLDAAKSGYLVVRSTSPISFTPSNGTIYNVNDVAGNGTVIYSANTSSMTDSTVTNETFYYYAIYSWESGYTYSAASLSEAKPSATRRLINLTKTFSRSHVNYTIDIDPRCTTSYFTAAASTTSVGIDQASMFPKPNLVSNSMSGSTLGWTNKDPRDFIYAFGGTYQYAADAANGIRKFSSAACASSTGSSWDDVSLGTVTTIRVSGNYGFLGHTLGMAVIDLSVPMTPTLVHNYADTLTPERETIVGNYLYLANGAGGIIIYDITDPLNVTKLGTFDTAGSAVQATASGNVAYVADSANGIVLLDISNKSAPSLIRTIPTVGNVNDVVIVGTDLYVTEKAGGLSVFDITLPTYPILMDRKTTVSSANALKPMDGFIFIATDDGFAAYEYKAQAPVLLGSGAMGVALDNITVKNNIIYAGHSGNSMKVVDITTNPNIPSVLSTYNTTARVRHVNFVGTYAYLSESATGIEVVDVSNSSSPSQVKVVTLASAYQSTQIGNYLYVANSTTGVEVLNVTTTNNPTYIGIGAAKTSSMTSIISNGNYLYVIDGTAGLKIFDTTSTPTTPSLFNTILTTSQPRMESLSGNFLHVSNGGTSYNWNSYDLQNTATAPTSYGSHLTTSFQTFNLTVIGNKGYVFLDSRVAIFDATTPSAPTYMATYNFGSGTVSAVAVNGQKLYVSMSDNNLYVFDISQM